MAAALCLARLVAAFTVLAVRGDREPPARAIRTPESAFCQLTMGKVSQGEDAGVVYACLREEFRRCRAEKVVDSEQQFSRGA